MVIFHSYVSLPEGRRIENKHVVLSENGWRPLRGKDALIDHQWG